MSLLNEALKRAQQAEVRPVQGPDTNLPLQPVAERPPPVNSAARVAAIAALVVFSAGMAALWSRGPAERAQAAPASAQQSENEVISETEITGLDEDEGFVHATIPDTESMEALPEVAAVAVPLPEPAAPEPVPEVRTTTATAPSFALTAIHYRLKHPSVTINGKTLQVGNAIDNAQVVAIGREWVHLNFDGKTNVLRLPPKS